MKTATAGFINWLAANTEFVMVELYDLLLTTGEAFRFTTHVLNLRVAVGPLTGLLYQTGPPSFNRGAREEVIGLAKIGTLDLEIHAGPSDFLGAVPIIQRVVRGDLDKAQITVNRLFMDPGLVQQATVILFSGYLGEPQEISRSIIRFQCRSRVEDLNISLPRNLIQPTCLNTLFDSRCTLSRSAFGVSGTIMAGSTVNKLVTTLTNPDDYFDNGMIKFTSGPLIGHVTSVKQSFNFAGRILMFTALPVAPNIGDTFTAFPGCDHTQPTCSNKFNNLVNFQGFPDVPVPETAI